MERMLCSVKEGEVHLALLAGNHSILKLKQGRALGSMESRLPSRVQEAAVVKRD